VVVYVGGTGIPAKLLKIPAAVSDKVVMTSERSNIQDELRFGLDLLHLLAGCETSSPADSVGAAAAANLAADLSQISAVQ
jgi:hypothetical protein